MAFFNSAVTVLQTLVIALGAGLGIWGAINRSADFLSGKSNRKCEPCSTVHDDRHVAVVLSGNV